MDAGVLLSLWRKLERKFLERHEHNSKQHSTVAALDPRLKPVCHLDLVRRFICCPAYAARGG